jgi:hypothetical protein
MVEMARSVEDLQVSTYQDRLMLYLTSTCLKSALPPLLQDLLSCSARHIFCLCCGKSASSFTDSRRRQLRQLIGTRLRFALTSACSLLATSIIIESSQLAGRSITNSLHSPNPQPPPSHDPSQRFHHAVIPKIHVIQIHVPSPRPQIPQPQLRVRSLKFHLE